MAMRKNMGNYIEQSPFRHCVVVLGYVEALDSDIPRSFALSRRCLLK